MEKAGFFSLIPRLAATPKNGLRVASIIGFASLTRMARPPRMAAHHDTGDTAC
jgi:hypothetical protein